MSGMSKLPGEVRLDPQPGSGPVQVPTRASVDSKVRRMHFSKTKEQSPTFVDIRGMHLGFEGSDRRSPRRSSTTSTGPQQQQAA